MKNSINTTGNRTRDLPVLSAVPQPTAPSRAPFPSCSFVYLLFNKALLYAAKRDGPGCGQRFRPWHTKYELPVHAQTKTLKNILGFIQEVGWQYQLLSRNWSVCARNTPTFWQFPCKHDFLYVPVSATTKHRRDVRTCTFLAVSLRG